MKLTTDQFKRIQYHVKALCDIGLDEEDILRVAEAGIKAYLHRKKGTSFNESQLAYQLKKVKDMTYEDYMFSDVVLDEFSFNNNSGALGKIKLYFEAVPDKIKKKINRYRK